LDLESQFNSLTEPKKKEFQIFVSSRMRHFRQIRK